MNIEARAKRPITSLSGPSLPFWRRIRWNLIFTFVVLAVVPVTVIVTLVLTQLRDQATISSWTSESVSTLKTQLIERWCELPVVLHTVTASDTEDRRFPCLPSSGF
jgi:hypothetical protein